MVRSVCGLHMLLHTSTCMTKEGCARKWMFPYVPDAHKETCLPRMGHFLPFSPSCPVLPQTNIRMLVWGNFYYISSMTKRIPRKLYLSRNGWRIKNNKRWSSSYLFILWLRSTWRPHISGGSGNFLSLCLMIMYVFSSHELLCIWYIDQISPWGWGVEVETTARSSAFLQTSNTLGNSDDTSCQTKLYQRATSFSSSTSGPKTIYLNFFFFFFKYPYQICSQTLTENCHICLQHWIWRRNVLSPNWITSNNIKSRWPWEALLKSNSDVRKTGAHNPITNTVSVLPLPMLPQLSKLWTLHHLEFRA